MSKSEARILTLEAAIRDLLRSLDRQALEGRAPGQYSYSGNVLSAMARCSRLVEDRAPAHPADMAHNLD